MSRFIDIDMQLGFKNFSVYGSIFHNIELYAVRLSIHLVNDPGLRFGPHLSYYIIHTVIHCAYQT